MSIPALSAMEAASAIYKVIDFCSKVMSDSRDIANTGVTVDIAHLKLVISDLKSLNVGLRRRPTLGDIAVENLLNREEQVRKHVRQFFTFS
jgi:hypothetical protein